MSLVEKPKDRSSTAGQKFWPLKKFNLHNHHGKNIEQQVAMEGAPLKPVQTAELETGTADEAKQTSNIEKDAQQKKSKNRRLSSLLSTNRRQEEATVNIINDSTNVDNETRKKSDSQQISTLTKKTGKEIKTRTTTYRNQKNSNMTAKSAGSGSLTRSQMTAKQSLTPSSPPLRQSFFKTKAPTRKAADDKVVKRSHSPPSKRNDSPTNMQQPPKIMLESVQQQIQQEDEKKIKKIEKSKEESPDIIKDADDSPSKAVDTDTAEEYVIVNHQKRTSQKKKQVQEIFQHEEEHKKQVSLEEDMDAKPSTSICSSDSSSDNDLTANKKQRQPSFPSPPATPAAVGLSEFSTVQSNEEFMTNDAKYNINSHYEPTSPTLCSFEEQCQHTKANEKPQQQSVNNNQNNGNGNSAIYMQQPIQRIQRLRPAASFATLRQLASTNGNFQYVTQQPLQQPSQIQQIKKRPVSFIEPSTYSNYNYATQTPPIAPASDDYLSVNRPIYYRRASSDDHGHYHIRHQSENAATIQFRTPSPPSSVAGNNTNGRRVARSNTVHNVIIKDGQGHRIVQCVELESSPPLHPLPLRRKTSSFESNESIQHYHDWSPPPEEDAFLSRQEDQQLLLMQHNNMAAIVLAQQEHNTDNSDSSSNNGCRGLRKMKRKDSAKSLSSLCSTSPPMAGFDFKYEQLKSKLEIEKATVRSLQKQKEAITKDLDFLHKNVDDLTAENTEWKRKYELEKTNRERFQDDLSDSLEKLSEATEQIRNLEKQNKQIKSELEEKLKDLEKKNKQMAASPRIKPSNDGKSNERLLAAQLHHSQNQVRLLKSTMEQFLRMGLFNDDLGSITSPTTSIDAIVSEIKCGRSKQRRSSAISSKSNSSTTNGDTPKTKLKKSIVPSEKKTEDQKPVESKSTPTAELDIQLRELLREKEILQAEYSKAPSSGGNALVRRRREELESRLDAIDSQMCRIKLKLRNRNIL